VIPSTGAVLGFSRKTPGRFSVVSPNCAFDAAAPCFPRLNTPPVLSFRYPYEEFADHIKAMIMVRNWEETSRFGHLGKAQTCRANIARVVEYFSDSYADQKEAVQKAELFLSIYDYIGRNAALFSRNDLMERGPGGVFSVEPALLRAVHYVFTVAVRPGSVEAKKVLALARALDAVEAPV
jgi:hypothetical protein